MAYNPKLHHRRSIRLKEWDYSRPGGYFVTICTNRREAMFGEVRGKKMRLNRYGRIVQQSWKDLPAHYHNTHLDEFIIMPNHVHGIIVVTENTAVGNAMNRRPLSEIIRALKSFSARRINALRGITGVPVWQRNYYEHIIRTEEELRRVREYIESNPLKWPLDGENRDNTAKKVSLLTPFQEEAHEVNERVFRW